jgi:hypothetical protein
MLDDQLLVAVVLLVEVVLRRLIFMVSGPFVSPLSCKVVSKMVVGLYYYEPLSV